jgi:hypothetical protein
MSIHLYKCPADSEVLDTIKSYSEFIPYVKSLTPLIQHRPFISKVISGCSCLPNAKRDMIYSLAGNSISFNINPDLMYNILFEFSNHFDVPLYDFFHRERILHLDYPFIERISNSSLNTSAKIGIVLFNESQRHKLEFELGNEVKSANNILLNNSYKPTPYLILDLLQSGNVHSRIDHYRSVDNLIAEGNFDPNDPLHVNLQYSEFCRLAEDEKIRKFIKSDASFSAFQSIFGENQENADDYHKNDLFEIKCVAYEARLLRDYILKVKGFADAIGRKLYVAPNLSYGYLPTSPIIQELTEEGIGVILGIKIGSSECHDNSFHVDRNLFKKFRSMIINEQPIIMILDGTQHIVSRDGKDKAARYPDSYKGFLSHFAAVNEALGFKDYDMTSLPPLPSNNQGRRETVMFYKGLLHNPSPLPYSFEFWNTAGMDLIVRQSRKNVGSVSNFSGEIKGPTVIFCNCGVLDNQIPEDAVPRKKEENHVPAYFDDSGRIISLNFGYDNYGIHFVNWLESTLKREYDDMFGKRRSSEDMPEIVKFARKKLPRTYQRAESVM